jgi:hypothetical protein
MTNERLAAIRAQAAHTTPTQTLVLLAILEELEAIKAVLTPRGNGGGGTNSPRDYAGSFGGGGGKADPSILVQVAAEPLNVEQPEPDLSAEYG